MVEKQKSINRNNLYYAIFSFLLILILIGTILTLIKRHSDRQLSNMLIENATTYAVVLEGKIKTVRDQLKQISSEDEVVELLLSNDTILAEEWALHYNKYLPNSLGLALLSNDGDILGDPHALRIGLACIHDLQNHHEPHNFNQLPIHNNSPKLKHFDVTSPVYGPNSELLGIVFASFYLTILQDVIDNLVQQGQQLRVIQADGTPVVETTPQTNLDTAHQVTIGGSDWQLELLSTPIDTSSFEKLVVLVSLLIGTIISIIIFMLSRKICGSFLEEIHNIRTGLRKIADGSFDDHFQQPKFIEMSEVLPAIEEVTDLIHRQKQELLKLSQTDELTGLPNRRKFYEELNKMWKLSGRGLDCCLLLIDLDNFKIINDSEGHSVGDIVLQLFANCLNNCRRETDIIGRLGGDEFAVLLPNTQNKAAAAWYHKLTDCFIASQTGHNELSGLTTCTLSCGIICMDPAYQSHFNEVVKNADEALYQAKSAGKNQMIQYELNREPLAEEDKEPGPLSFLPVNSGIKCNATFKPDN